jgi:hypothetical protein
MKNFKFGGIGEGILEPDLEQANICLREANRAVRKGYARLCIKKVELEEAQEDLAKYSARKEYWVEKTQILSKGES